MDDEVSQLRAELDEVKAFLENVYGKEPWKWSYGQLVGERSNNEDRILNRVSVLDAAHHLIVQTLVTSLISNGLVSGPDLLARTQEALSGLYLTAQQADDPMQKSAMLNSAIVIDAFNSWLRKGIRMDASLS